MQTFSLRKAWALDRRATCLYSTKGKVLLGMSGGVDSSVSAHLLQSQGYKVEGLYMHSWDSADEAGCPTSESDWLDVQRVCSMLDIKCRRQSFVKEYWSQVFESFIYDYRQGWTPNPDILCNRNIKFVHFANEAIKSGCDFFATGHYAGTSTAHDTGKVQLRRDLAKDQSYFLCQVPYYLLEKCLFPLASLAKVHVKAMARDLGLPVYGKSESMGVCFIGERKMRPFLEKYLHSKPGNFRSIASGEVKGQHLGLSYYTIGQRARVSGGSHTLFVARKDSASNTIWVTHDSQHPALLARCIKSDDFIWISGRAPDFEDKLFTTVIRSTDKIGLPTVVSCEE